LYACFYLVVNYKCMRLHSFYLTHSEPFPYKVKTIKKLCGSNNKNLCDFRNKLKNAIKELSSATGWNITIDANDLIVVQKNKPNNNKIMSVLKNIVKKISLIPAIFITHKDPP